MRIQLISLTVKCKESVEIIEFNQRLTFFHGTISAGKSTVAYLIDFCFGGDLVKTPAIQAEFVAAALTLMIGKNEVLIERQLGSNKLEVSWRGSERSEALLAPLAAGDEPIYGSDVYNLSDLILKLSEVDPIKFRRSQSDPESEMVRLSFRDIFKFCYLQQRKLDSSFYDLNTPILKTHSRAAMRFFVGMYSEQLRKLEQDLASFQKQRKDLENSVKENSRFLEEAGISSQEKIEVDITRCQLQLKKVEEERSGLRRGYEQSTSSHTTDELRNSLRDLGNRLEKEKETLDDLSERIAERNSLKADLISNRIKLSRATSANTVLAGVRFEKCPCCGLSLLVADDNDSCNLCGQNNEESEQEAISQRKETIDSDLKMRIEELSEAIKRYQNSIGAQRRLVEDLSQKKAILDRQLGEELAIYDSKFVAAARSIERKSAELEEKINSLRHLQRLPAKVNKQQEEINRIKERELQLKKQINSEKEDMQMADLAVSNLEIEYKDLLERVMFPGISPDDSVVINRTSFIPSILPHGNQSLSFTFDEAGSAGKCTLLNVCFGLALHTVSQRRKLPLPNLLIIDSPMKNISADVNREMFEAFFECLYELAESELKRTQFVIIENDYIPPASDSELMVSERFMTKDDPDNPPLIKYYRGH